MPAEASNLHNPALGQVPEELLALDGETPKEGDLPTLLKVGRKLPIGFTDQNGVQHRNFSLVEWDWEMEERLGALAEENPGMPINEYASEVIGNGLAKIGTIDVAAMKRSARRLLARSLYFSDALYIYVWIRINALGHVLKLQEIECVCRKRIRDYTGDLRTLEVKLHDEIPSKRIETEYGVEYGGKRLRTFVVGPMRWAFMEDADAAVLANPAKFRLATLQHAVTGIDGAPEGPIHLTAEHLRTMRPRDVNRLVGEIDGCNGGAVMEISGTCPHCRREFRREIDWSYDDFFAPSSH